MNPDRLAELEEQRRFLIGSLADLEREHDAGDVSADDYATLRDDYTARAATVLRAIEVGRMPATRPRRRLPWLGLALTVVFGAVAGWLLVRNVGERAPGDTITGVDLGPAGTDVSSLMVRARTILAEDPLGAMKLFERVLNTEPDNVEAITYRGWAALFPAMRLEPGGDRDVLVASAAEYLDRAVVTDPTYVDAQCFSAILRFRFQDDARGAKGPYDRCVAGNPTGGVAPFVEALGESIDEALAAG